MTILSWIGNVLIVLGLWYQGQQVWWAYTFAIVGEVCWIIYALHQHMGSLAFICAIFGMLAARNLYLWRRAAS